MWTPLFVILADIAVKKHGWPRWPRLAMEDAVEQC
jgi:hypothetical protein